MMIGIHIEEQYTIHMRHNYRGIKDNSNGDSVVVSTVGVDGADMPGMYVDQIKYLQ